MHLVIGPTAGLTIPKTKHPADWRGALLLKLLIGFVTVHIAFGDVGSRPYKSYYTYKARSASAPLLVPNSNTKQKAPRHLPRGFLFGAANRIRTDDLVITNDVLYRLSYSSVVLTTVIL